MVLAKKFFDSHADAVAVGETRPSSDVDAPQVTTGTQSVTIPVSSYGGSHQAEADVALVHFCHALLNLNEFTYIE
jgi:hypothetical protein